MTPIKLSPQQVTEVNTLIAEIEKVVKPKSEIGAREKAILAGLLKTSKIEKKPVFFKCKREYSDTIVTHFVKEKGLTKSRFHMNGQSFVFVLLA
jgi:hypothetical protein